MNQKHLLRFIKKTLKNYADQVVTCSKNGDKMTLREVFQSMNLTTYDLSVDMLDVHAVSYILKRYDIYLVTDDYRDRLSLYNLEKILLESVYVEVVLRLLSTFA